jgi:beta-glucosidase
VDLDRETNGDMMLVTTLRIDSLSAAGTSIAMHCGARCGGTVAIGRQLAALPRHQWLRVGLSLKCFRAAGADMTRLEQPFAWRSNAGEHVDISAVAASTVADKLLECPVH